MAGASAAEEKISAALNKELDVVEKECMRSMQVSCSTTLSAALASQLARDAVRLKLKSH